MNTWGDQPVPRLGRGASLVSPSKPACVCTCMRCRARCMRNGPIRPRERSFIATRRSGGKRPRRLGLLGDRAWCAHGVATRCVATACAHHSIYAREQGGAVRAGRCRRPSPRADRGSRSGSSGIRSRRRYSLASPSMRAITRRLPGPGRRPSTEDRRLLEDPRLDASRSFKPPVRVRAAPRRPLHRSGRG